MTAPGSLAAQEAARLVREATVSPKGAVAVLSDLERRIASLSPQSRVLFDTSDPFDAGLVGHDGPCTPSEGGLRLTIGADHIGPTFTLTGPDGEVVLQAPEAKIIAGAIADQMRYAKPKET